jgi:LmbE family N-acetylglucosaminyl deacetylase
MELRLSSTNAEIYIPDGKPLKEALNRTTHVGIGAHPDDLEIMAYHGILECYNSVEKWFFGIVLTDGAGSPRSGIYGNYSDEEMREIRRKEQKKAAVVGEYSGVALLNYSSDQVKSPNDVRVKEDLKKILSHMKPETVYVHNIADKHDTHVAAALRAIEALRELPQENRPKYLYGCEVWRSLDWLLDEDKVCLDVSQHENLSIALVNIFDSQISGGKRYNIATLGRRYANATYHASHQVDYATSMIYCMDLTPLIKNTEENVKNYVLGYINRFSADVAKRIERVGG